MTPRGQYIIPEDNQPEGYYCFTTYVPKDTLYLQEFFGAFQDFCKWTSWAEDGEGRAAEAANTWKLANELTHAAFAEAEGCDMPVFRINPETCLLEVQCDDEAWQPVFTPSYDPTMDGEIVPPYPDAPSEGQSNECLAAANAAESMQRGTADFIALLDGGSPIGVIISALYTFISAMVNIATGVIWGTFIPLFSSFDAATLAADYAAFDWQELIDLLVCYYQPDGTITEGDWSTVLTTMQTNAAAPNQVWLYIAMIWGLMGTVGAANAARWAGITEADCASCEPCETLDFLTGEQGWEAYDDNDTTPPVHTADGWEMQLWGSVLKAGYIVRNYAETMMVTSIRVVVETNETTNTIQLYRQTFPTAIADVSGFATGIYEHVFTLGSPVAIDELYVYVRTFGGDTFIREIEVCVEE